VLAGKFAQVSGVQAPASGATHWLNTHVCPAGQVAHVSRLPHPSSVLPQAMLSWLHVCGTHDEPASTGTHMLFAQVLPCGHVPQSAVTPPQPLEARPHCRPSEVQVAGVQLLEGKPHWLAMPPPPQVAGDVHGLQKGV
jgi:hypothetical protein